MPSHTCPFCGHTAAMNQNTYREIHMSFDDDHRIHHQSPHLVVKIFRCPNQDCQQDSVAVKGINGYIDGSRVDVYPISRAIHFPEYIPEAIRADYEEACAITSRSPKAAATLARRCLQGMIRDFWGIRKGRLVDEVAALQGLVSPSQWAAIDALRKIGNIGAHMEKDVNCIIDVDPAEAEKLVKLIELLLKEWYVSRHEEEELYKKITDTADQKAATKKSYQGSNGSSS